jgi:predicted RNA-binding Zn-ribbon protein involved in translation (DUF1610 family)
LDGLRGLLETLKKIRYDSPQPKFCPKCRGYNIKPKQSFGILPQQYRCDDCGYEGTIFLELDEDRSQKPTGSGE